MGIVAGEMLTALRETKSGLSWKERKADRQRIDAALKTLFGQQGTPIKPQKEIFGIWGNGIDTGLEDALK